jgi:hypothetical protein
MINEIRYNVSRLPYTDPALKEQLIAMIDYIKELEAKLALLARVENKEG